MRTFEDKLKILFDYQSFDPNPEIEAMMQETEAAYLTGLRLSDESLEMVAGGQGTVEPITIIKAKTF